MNYDVIVIGGGAAGLMAAGTAIEYGQNVLIIEKNKRVGRKLLITGKGRCNITNNCDKNEFLKNIRTNPKFLYSAISKFSTEDTMNFFENLGVPLKTERGNRVFPQSDKASDIVEALQKYTANATFIVDEAIAILQQDGAVSGVKCVKNSYTSNKVIIATGGKSYPLTGSTGSGYKLARNLGHTVTAVTPSLIPIISNDTICEDMQGLSLKNVELSLLDNNKVIFKELGEMIFTHFGVSGPLVLSASSYIKPYEPNRYTLKIDLKPGLSNEQLDARILRDFAKFTNKDFFNSLGELLPKKMIPIIVQKSEIPPLIKVNQITKEMRQGLCVALKGLSITVDGLCPIEEAIITSGGIEVKEIDPKTMESKFIVGLYFAGEVIDVDGYTGGFNLQIAFSTGRLAGSC